MDWSRPSWWCAVAPPVNGSPPNLVPLCILAGNRRFWSPYPGHTLECHLWHCSTPYERIGWTNWVQIKNQCTLSHPACAYQVWCESEDMTPCYGFAYGPGVINIITLWKTTSLSTASEAQTFGDFGPPGGGGRRCNSNNREAISGS